MSMDLETYYLNLRRSSARQLQQRREELEARDPGFALLQQKRSRVFSMTPQGAKLALNAIRLEEEGLLRQHGLPRDYLQPVYRCSLCRDTGYVGEPLKRKCTCRMKLEQEQLSESARINPRETFEHFSGGIYPDQISLQNGKQIAAFCEKYADTLPRPKICQLYLFGQAGRGKSFMGNAMAARAIERGVEALRLTAYRMTEEVMQGFSTGLSPLSRYVQVPLLVLDDLGTEPMIPNVTAETLFSVADQRSSGRLATVYISNLTPGELTDRYGDRIASRITDKAITKLLPFEGGSLRGGN